MHPPPRPSLPSFFFVAGGGGGRGRATRPRPRHCNRLQSRKPGHPPVPRRLRFSREEAPSLSPSAARMGLFCWLPFLAMGTRVGIAHSPECRTYRCRCSLTVIFLEHLRCFAIHTSAPVRISFLSPSP